MSIASKRALVVVAAALGVLPVSFTYAQESSPPEPAPIAAESTTAQPGPAEPQKKPDPFAFADFTWLSGNPRTKESPLDSKVFTGEFRVDTNFTYSFNKPIDDTISGSSEIFRS